MPRHLRIRLRGLEPFLAPHPFNLKDLHQPCDLVAADLDAGPLGCFPEHTHTIDRVVRFPDFKELRRYLRIPSLPGRGWPAGRDVIRGRGHLQYFADALDPEATTGGDAVLVRVDECHYILCWRPGSAPKKDAARFKISFARLSSRTSCSSSRIRA